MIAISEALSMAIHSTLILAEKPGVFQSGKQIAEICRFSQHHLAKVLGQLTRAGLLESQRGPSGGVRFVLKPGKVTLAMIRDAIEGRDPAPKGCLLALDVCPGQRCVVGRLFAKMEADIERVFQTTTLADVLRSITK